MRCSDGLVLSITALAIAVADALTDPEDLELLASALIQFSDTLDTLLTVRSRTAGTTAETSEAIAASRTAVRAAATAEELTLSRLTPKGT